MSVETNFTTLISSTTNSNDFFVGRFFIIILYTAYVQPFIVGIGLLNNFLVIVAMARVRREFSRNVRIYYSVLAAADFVLVAMIFTGDFLEWGIAYLTSGGQNFPILTVNGSNWFCKFGEAIWLTSDTVAGFTLVCLGFERVIAVTWPLRAKTILTLRFSVVFLTSVNLVAVLSFVPLLCVVYSIVEGIGCWYDLSLPITNVYIILENVVPLEYSFFSFAFNVYLTVKIVLATLKRSHMLSGGADASKISSREISNITMLLSIEAFRMVIYLPLSAVIIAYLWITDDLVVNLVNLFSELSLIPHAINFFVYFARSRAFREAICGKLCSKDGVRSSTRLSSSGR